jgi:hypothetical protein
MRSTLISQVLITLLITIMLMDAATLTTPHDNATNLHDSSYFRKMLDFFPWCFRRGTSEKQLHCLMKENIKNVNDMICGNISPALLQTTKLTLMKNRGQVFHLILGVDSKKIGLPNELGRYILLFYSVGDIDIFVVEKVLDYFQPEQAPSWDPKFSGDSLTLGYNNRSVSLQSGGGFNGVQSSKPCSRYSVQVVQGTSIYLGFAPRLGFQKNKVNFDSCGWFLFVFDGKLWSQDGTYNKAYSTAIPEGRIVTAIHDKSYNTIEFHVDGNSLGIAFTNVPDIELFAAADFYGVHAAEIRIIDNS